MGINLSDLAPELRRQILDQAGIKAAPAVRQARRKPAARSALMRRCSCLFEIFRPDGDYPADCDGCGKPWTE